MRQQRTIMNREKQVIMDNEFQNFFRLAAKFFYKKYKKNGGSQKKLAQDLGVTQSYLSSVINGSKSGSLNLQTKIANILYGPYDQFLLVGRRLKEGIELQGKQKQQLRDNVETLLAKLTHCVMDQKRANIELEQTHDLYMQVIENLQSGVFVTNKNDKVFFANQFMSEIEGTSVDQIIGIDILSEGNEFPNADRRKFAAHYFSAKKTLKPVFFKNIPIVTAAGELIRQTGWAIPRLKDSNYDGMICNVNRIERKKRKAPKRKNKT